MESIFELENRLDIHKELVKLLKTLYNDNSNAIIIGTASLHYTLIQLLNNSIFLNWKYRDTFLSVEEFLEHIGVYSTDILNPRPQTSKTSFMYFLEFLANMHFLIKKTPKINLSPKSSACLNNIPLILEKMNYQLETLDDRVIITKRNADVDSALSIVPKNIAAILLEYNDFRIQNNLAAKKKILKDIDLYIEKNIKLKSFDKELDNAIGTIVNKMGINHPIEDEPYKSFSKAQLLEWYDKCFLMMLHAIRIPKIIDIKNERKTILSN